MASNLTPDAVIIGGGHNGLVHAAYLGRAGKKALVLERSHMVGGPAVTPRHTPPRRPRPYPGDAASGRVGAITWRSPRRGVSLRFRPVDPAPIA